LRHSQISLEKPKRDTFIPESLLKHDLEEGRMLGNKTHVISGCGKFYDFSVL
jgi:hypothetical protein